MQDKSDSVIRGIVGIIAENNKDGLSSHNGIGSGVIFDRIDNTCCYSKTCNKYRK